MTKSVYSILDFDLYLWKKKKKAKNRTDQLSLLAFVL